MRCWAAASYSSPHPSSNLSATSHVALTETNKVILNKVILIPRVAQFDFLGARV
jgi:hypothetical protein